MVQTFLAELTSASPYMAATFAAQNCPLAWGIWTPV